MEFGMNMTPNDFYRGTQQAFVNGQWENTAVEETVEEQDYIGADTYHKVSVWVSKAIGTTSTFMKNGQDFRTLLYRELDYHPVRGTYFKFEDNWWIADFTNPADGVMGDVGIRRCTNYLKIIDPENGNVFSIPCVLDYDMTSPSMTVTKSILTPNNHAFVIVQANPDTLRLFKYNKRFMLNDRVFKLIAFQNALYTSVSEKKPTILYLDMILDELHDGDDKENGIANNGEYHYEVIINNSDMMISDGHEPIPVGAITTLNGERVERDIIWTSSNTSVAEVVNGYIYFYHKGAAIITAHIRGNENVCASIKVAVESKKKITPTLTMVDAFDTIRQYETKTTQFVVNGDAVRGIICFVVNDDKSIQLEVDNDKMIVTCLKPSEETQIVHVVATTIGNEQVAQEFNIRAVSMMG